MNKEYGNTLHPADRAKVLAMFVHRMTVENLAARPWLKDRMGYALPIITDEVWLTITQFSVRKDGRLDGRARFCQTDRPLVR